jgi:hypothetical protein
MGKVLDTIEEKDYDKLFTTSLNSYIEAGEWELVCKHMIPMIQREDKNEECFVYIVKILR